MTEVTPLSAAQLVAAIGPVTLGGKTVPVVEQLPDRDPPAPGIVVGYDEPWIENTEGLPHGVFTFAYVVRVLAGRGFAGAQQDRALALTQTVIARLTDSQTWQVGTATAPRALTYREGVTFLGVDLSVNAYATITED